MLTKLSILVGIDQLTLRYYTDREIAALLSGRLQEADLVNGGAQGKLFFCKLVLNEEEDL